MRGRPAGAKKRREGEYGVRARAALDHAEGRNSLGENECRTSGAQAVRVIAAPPPSPLSKPSATQSPVRCESCDEENEDARKEEGKVIVRERTSPIPLASTLLRVKHIRVARAEGARLREVVFCGRRKHGRHTGHVEENGTEEEGKRPPYPTRSQTHVQSSE